MHEELLTLLENKKYHQLKEQLTHIEPADIAISFEELSEHYRPLLFRLLP